MANGLSFPTILVAEDDEGVRSALVRDLQHLGYFVLAAQDGSEAVEIVRVHSRPIHLMLTDESVQGRTLAATLKQYRPNMYVVFTTRYANGEGLDAVGAEITVAKVQELLHPPANPDSGPMETRRPLAKVRLAGAAHDAVGPSLERDAFDNP